MVCVARIAPLLLATAGACPWAALAAQTITPPTPAASAPQPTSAASGSVPTEPTAGSALRPGDLVRIAVWRKAEFSGEFLVAEDSSILHPLYRAVKVAGVPLPLARARLLEFLRHFDADPQFVLEPLLRVTVRGEVARPNVYTLPPATTIAQAVAMAGGPTERGRRDRVQLVRGASVTRVDMTAAEGAARSPIRSGDELVVERQRSIFREYVTPTFTIAGAIAAMVGVVVRARR
jgi:polysaccharide export outer membrane protein